MLKEDDDKDNKQQSTCRQCVKCAKYLIHCHTIWLPWCARQVPLTCTFQIYTFSF